MEAACASCLARREHSRDELRLKLVHKGFPESLVAEVIADFSARGWQSDARYAEALARNRVAQGYGAYRIRQELRQRGVTDGVMAELPVVDWDEQIYRTYIRKFGEAPLGALRERAARERYLLRKGFSGDQIRRLLRRLHEADGNQ